MKNFDVSYQAVEDVSGRFFQLLRRPHWVGFVQGLPFEVLRWRSFYREAVGFLVWGLCRLELPSEMFTCFIFFCFVPPPHFGVFLCLEEGFVMSCAYSKPLCCTFSVGWMRQLSEDAFLIKLKMPKILKLALVFVICGMTAFIHT